MSSSFSISESESYTVTHARHKAAKVATDLKRMQRLYEKPEDARIQDFETELTALLKAGYLKTVTYGFRRDNKWIEPTLIYTAQDLTNSIATDDDPGRIPADANVEGANFYTYLTRNTAWHNLTSEEQEDFNKSLPFQRTGAPEPAVNGYISQDKSYSAGGKALNRSTVKSLI